MITVCVERFLLILLFMLWFFGESSVIATSGLGGCDRSWLEYRGHCYKFFNERKTWSSAREFCRALRGDLVVVKNEETQKFVYEKLAVGKTLWIGLRRNNGGVFLWVDGTDVKFQNWVSGSPDDMNEECGEMTDYGQFHGRWNDKHCSWTQPYICEQANNFENVFKVLPGKILLGHVVARLHVKSDVECLLRCQRFSGCESINFVRCTTGAEKQSLCELNRRASGEFTSEHLHTEGKSSYYYHVVR